MPYFPSVHDRNASIDIAVARDQWLRAKEAACATEGSYDGDDADLACERASEALRRYCRMYRDFYGKDAPEIGG